MSPHFFKCHLAAGALYNSATSAFGDFRRTNPRQIHPLWLRATHWLNALAVLLMVASGWRIYNAAPLLRLSLSPRITLGGWLGGALQWHFAAMWLLVVNGLVYLALNLASGRFARKFFPLSPRALLARPARRPARPARACRPAHVQRRAARGLSLRDRSTRCCWCCRAWCCGSRCSSRCCASCMGGYEGARLRALLRHGRAGGLRRWCIW